MKLSFYIIAVILVVAAVKAENKPGHCHDSGIDIKEGETVAAPIGKCHGIKCDDASKNSISNINCPELELKTCFLDKPYLTRQYPDCCPLTICP